MDTPPDFSGGRGEDTEDHTRDNEQNMGRRGDEQNIDKLDAEWAEINLRKAFGGASRSTRRGGGAPALVNVGSSSGRMHRRRWHLRATACQLAAPEERRGGPINYSASWPLRGAPHAGKSGVVARRGRCFLAQLSPLFSLIRGADVGAAHCRYEHEGPTLSHPCLVPAGDRAHVTGCAGRIFVMEEVDDAELVVERVAALDLGKAGLEAWVRVPHPQRPGRRMQEPPPRSCWKWWPGCASGACSGW
jgi:hypothetical protein